MKDRDYKQENMVCSAIELREWFHHCYNATKLNEKRRESLFSGGLYVDSKVRKELLTSKEQGKIIIGIGLILIKHRGNYER